MDKQSKIAMIIPMRMASTRLAKKQSAIIGEKPLIYHVLDNALRTKIRPIYIACDHQDHFDLVKKYPGNIEPIMTSLHHKSGSDRIFEATEILSQRGEKFDIVINLQGDMPFFEPEIIDKTLDLLNSNPEFDLATCAVMSNDENFINSFSNPKVVISVDNSALYFSRSVIPYQAKECALHIGIYAYRIDALRKFISLPVSKLEMIEKLEQLRALENNMKIGVCIVNSSPISVDTPECLELAKEYYAKKYNKI